ncbi:MAG TPA: hypothetical protein VFS94_08610 [Gemmatimonadales bacterium]|nr:hypothetical protein [Gemmatimonadales bacterium]
MRSRGWFFTGAAMAGMLTGWSLSQQRILAHRRDLFSKHPIKRLAALGYLAGTHTPDTVRLLRDYVAWEPQPLLRRRGETILRKLEVALA